MLRAIFLFFAHRFSPPSTLVAGFLLASHFILPGCRNEDVIVVNGVIGEPFSVRATEYCDKHFFLDTSYIPFYEPYYNSEYSVVLDPDRKVSGIEVWVEAVGAYDPGEVKKAVAWIELPNRPPAGYDESYTTEADIPGERETGVFSLLHPSSYMLDANGLVGTLQLRTTLIDLQKVAVGYKRADGLQFGDFETDMQSTTDTLHVLKLVKPANLAAIGPAYEIAWSMQLKNHYRLRNGSHVSSHGFQLDIVRSANDSSSGMIQGIPLLMMLGLDRYNRSGALDPDGSFDFRVGLTIDPDEGEIRFPMLRPFDNGILDYCDHHNIQLADSLVLFHDVYDSIRRDAQNSPRALYSIDGTAIFD